MKNVHPFLNKKVIVAMLAILAAILFAGIFLFFFYILPRTNSQGSVFADRGHERKYHVLVVGQADNSAFLNQVFEGASSLSEQFDSVVEFRAPSLQAENTSLQSLIDYASLVNCDGIIAYVNPNVSSIEKPLRFDGSEIPLVTIGHYAPEIPQISFIGNNYSILGRQIGIESEEMAKTSDRILIVISGTSSNPNFGNMVNNLVMYYKSKDIHSYEILDKSEKENEEHLIGILKNQEIKKTSIVCLTENDSIKTMRTLTSLFPGRRVNVLAFGENETLEIYLNKGLLSKLVTLDPVKIGRTAMMELFEYKSRGYANNYISAEIRVRTGK